MDQRSSLRGVMRQGAAIAAMLAAFGMLSGCGHEEGFEYQTRATLTPLNDSGVKGSVIIGYAIDGPENFRMRAGAKGLMAVGVYEIRLLKAASCAARDLDRAKRLDRLEHEFSYDKDAWVFNDGKPGLSGNLFGYAEKDFILLNPSRYADLNNLDDYPTVVVLAPRASHDKTGSGMQRVACGKFTETMRNMRPHM